MQNQCDCPGGDDQREACFALSSIRSLLCLQSWRDLVGITFKYLYASSFTNRRYTFHYIKSYIVQVTLKDSI
jgi:hypothetical protein